ncbi:MAG TPA: NAD(P)H-binding protein [Terriglobia bacterium]|nr:NAD(P)H-binding protein [Terriglobia bacterium]
MEEVPERLNIVTGAFGFLGKYITGRLLASGDRVRALTNHAPCAPAIDVAHLEFRNPQALERSMAAATVLYNTYWVRFGYRGVGHDTAVENTGILIRAAERAGVQRVVHISVTNPSPDSPFTYFRGKAAVENIIRSSSLSYAILRPALVFGREDILINNIAWLLRKFPFFAIPGDGEYGLQPIFVDDLAALAIENGHGHDNIVIDAVGPEMYKYVDLVQLIRETIHSRCRVVCAPSHIVRAASWVLGLLVRDIVLTGEEMKGLMANLLVSNQSPTGRKSLSEWLRQNSDSLGIRYTSEIERHYRTTTRRVRGLHVRP